MARPRLSLVALAWALFAAAGPAAAQQADGEAPPPARPSTSAAPIDPSLPPPAAPSAGAAEPARPPAAAEGGAPTGKAEAADSGALAGLALNAITVRTLILQKKFELALQVAEATLKRYPRDLEVAMQRARLLFWLGRVPEAEAAAVTVYQTDSRDTDALRLVGQIRESRGDAAGAIRAYREAQLRGDGDVRLAVRLVALYLAIDRPELARGQVRPGMALPLETERALTLAEHPWLAQGLIGLSAYQGDLWGRAEVSAAYRWSQKLTLSAGLYGEQRNTTISSGGAQGTTLTNEAFGVYGWLFFEVSRLSGDVRLFVAPEAAGFLPPVDLWAEGAWNFGPFALGLWARLATYEIAALWSIGPYLPIYLGRLTLTPGYLLVGRGKGPDSGLAEIGQVGHTVYLKSNWEFDVMTSIYAWLYVGQEVVFTNRTVSAPDESAVSLVLGWDHWFNHRFGVRVMATGLHQLQLGNQWYDIALMARVRL